MSPSQAHLHAVDLPAAERPDPVRDARVREQRARLPATQRKCRAWGHDWPFKDIEPGEELPPRTYVQPDAEGGQLIGVCGRCGREAVITLLPRGVYPENAVRRYYGPYAPNDAWVTLDRDTARPRLLQKEIIDEALKAKAKPKGGKGKKGAGS